MAWGPYQGTISFFVDMASHITDMGAISLHRGAISLCKGTRSFCVENKIQYGHSLATLNHGAPDQVQPFARIAASRTLGPLADTMFYHSKNLAKISLKQHELLIFGPNWAGLRLIASSQRQMGWFFQFSSVQELHALRLIPF